MEDQRRDVEAGLFRNRRGLLAASVVWAFIILADVTVDRIDIFGIEAKVQWRPAVDIAMLLTWFYFLVRYSQYLHDLTNRGLRASYDDRLNALAKKKAEQRFRSERAKGLIEGTKSLLDWELAETSIYTRGQEKWAFKVRAAMTIKDPDSEMYKKDATYDITIETSDLRLTKLRAAMHVLVVTRLGTEYFLPYIVAIAAMVLGVLKYAGSWGSAR